MFFLHAPSYNYKYFLNLEYYKNFSYLVMLFNETVSNHTYIFKDRLLFREVMQIY